jgi:hypothetical protein
MPTPLPTPLSTPLPLQTPLGSPSISDNEGDGMMEFYATPTSSDDEAEGAAPSKGQKDTVKDEDMEKFKDEIKDELKREVEIKEEKIDVKGAPLKSEAKADPKRNPRKRQAVEIDSGSDVNEVIDDGDQVIDSEDSVELEIEVGSDDDGSGSVFEQLSSGSSSAVEYVDATFLVPSRAASLRRICAHFVHRCLRTLFAHRGALWARSKVDAFFQDVFYRRSVFSPDEITQIEAWQARIKVLQKNGERAVGETNNPLEAHRPVIDSREMRTVIDSASNAWAAKQTFDSRDQCGGSKIIR